MPPPTNMPPAGQDQISGSHQSWNKLAIVVVVSAVLGFFAFPLLAGIIGMYAIAIPLVPVVGVILGIVALRQIKYSGEKGKVAAWIGTTVSALQLFGFALLMLLGVAVTAQNSNVTFADAVRMALSWNQQIELSDASIDKRNIAGLQGFWEFMEEYKRNYGHLPSEAEFFELTFLDREYFAYVVFGNGNEAVSRIMLKEDRDRILESSMDSDGVVGGLDCSDEHRYFCKVYPRR